jgi:hypothetical protein
VSFVPQTQWTAAELSSANSCTYCRTVRHLHILSNSQTYAHTVEQSDICTYCRTVRHLHILSNSQTFAHTVEQSDICTHCRTVRHLHILSNSQTFARVAVTTVTLVLLFKIISKNLHESLKKDMTCEIKTLRTKIINLHNSP